MVDGRKAEEDTRLDDDPVSALEVVSTLCALHVILTLIRRKAPPVVPARIQAAHPVPRRRITCGMNPVLLDHMI